MPITKEEVLYIANLARLEISEADAEKFTREMENMIEFTRQLSELDTSGVAPTSHVINLENVFREDAAGGSYPADILLENAPERQDGFYLVPKTARSDKEKKHGAV